MKPSNLTIITLKESSITDFAVVRNSELAKVKTDWVLYVDSDETISKELEEEICLAVASKDYDAYYLRRIDKFLGRELQHGETGNAKFVRLAKKDFGEWIHPVHEKWVPRSADFPLRIGTLKNPIFHSSHPTISSFLDKINNYSTLDAQYRFSQGKKSSLFKIALYPLVKFKVNYLFKLGFLDGVPGAIMAIMMSFHSYLTWTKLYLLWRQNLPRTKL